MDNKVQIQLEIETSDARHIALNIFEQHVGKPYFTTENLGLWATFLSTLEIEPSDFSHINHRLLECSFLNISFDTSDIDWVGFDKREQIASINTDCLMIPCARTTNDAQLIERGYFCLSGFFNSRAEFDSDWHTYLRQQCGSKRYLGLMREMRRLSCYQSRWMSLRELVAEPAVFNQVVEIYLNNASKFTYPAIHFNRNVLLALADSPLASGFRVCITLADKSVVGMMFCVVDQRAGYIAFPVHGVKYEAVPPEHNLYKLNYVHAYEFMADNGLHNFDMARGFVDVKKRLGANRVIPLSTYLKPLTQDGIQYVKTLLSAISRQQPNH